MIGILTPILISMSPNEMIQDMREWKSERDRTPIQEMLNNTLTEYEHGCNDPTESEELLQLPSDEDKPCTRWRHDRCDDRPRVRSVQEGEGQGCRCGHPRKEDKGS